MSYFDPKKIAQFEALHLDANDRFQKARRDSEIAAIARVTHAVLEVNPTAMYLELSVADDSEDFLFGTIIDDDGLVIGTVDNEQAPDIWDVLQDLPRHTPEDEPRFDCFRVVPGSWGFSLGTALNMAADLLERPEARSIHIEPTAEQWEVLDTLDNPHIRQVPNDGADGAGHGTITAYEVIDDYRVSLFTITTDGSITEEILNGYNQGWARLDDEGYEIDSDGNRVSDEPHPS
ncbi:MAG TPA: hypothetical protein VFU07_05440 [Candidatus Lumbricidophila sp.]|nr:hypothetical protein [Candidatus Lumbricidophila sp.]